MARASPGSDAAARGAGRGPEPRGAWFVQEVVSACRGAPDVRLVRQALEALPECERDARQELQRALAAAVERALQPAEAPFPCPDGPLQTTTACTAPPHELLERCYEFLAHGEHPGGAFERRAGQLEMAHAVLDALERQETLLVEAGTGSGKSLAYALPAILFTWRRDRRVVLATHTRTLQEQLVRHELPWLWTRLGLGAVEGGDGRRGLRFAKLLGRANYVCNTALERSVQAAAARGGDTEVVRLLLALMARGDGSLDEIFPGWDAGALDGVRSRRETCTGRTCRGDPPCPVYAARERARAADIVVVNHALLCEDARLEGTLLGDCGALVVDEAHALERVATEALACRVDSGQTDALVEAVRRLESELHHVTGAASLPAVAPLVEACLDVRRRQAALLDELDGALPRAARVRPRQRYRDPDEVFARAEASVAALRAAFAAATAAAATMAAACSPLAVMAADGAGAAALADLVCVLLHESEAAFEFVRRAADEDWVYQLDFGGTDARLQAIAALPLEVGPMLQRLLDQPERAVVYTSATLFVGADADYVRRRLGLPARVRQLAVPSPFDYEVQCTVARTASLGDYRDPEFVPGLAAVIEALHRTTRRRMLVLLTSHGMLRALHGELATRLGAAAPLLAQGLSADRDTLAARLAATPAAVLLGTASFWEGVDFPGAALEILVLCKLPFAPPDEPLVEARGERLRARGEDAFTGFVLPEAVLRFRQGFGRLIRTRRDRGAVLLLDGRIDTRQYGETFAAALPVQSTAFVTPAALVDHVHAWLGPEPAG